MSPLTEPTRLTLRKSWQPMDPDAAAYITAVETADAQTLEEPVKIAIDNFVLGCKSDGIWSAIKASCILAGARTLSGALVPLVGTAPTNNNFVSGDYNRKTGLVGNGTSKYLNSNRNYNADPQDNFHISAYAGAEGFSNSIFMGANGANNYRLIERATGASRFNTGNAAGGFYDVSSASSPSGFYGITRSLSSSANVRVGGLGYTASVNSVAVVDRSMFVYCRNNDGVAANFSNARLAFYSIGESLNLALLDARVSALITAFGVAIP